MRVAPTSLLLRPALLAWAALGSGCYMLDAPPEAPPPADAQVQLGRQLATQYQCGSCHAIPEVPAARGRLGPTLERFGRRTYIAGHLPNEPGTLARWIASPQALVPGTLMPDMGVRPDEARAIAAFLGSLQ